MTQIAQPTKDLSTNAWFPTPVYSQINELVPDDSTFVSTADEPQADIFECKLASISPPGPGPQTLYVRVRGIGVLDHLVATCSLMQGTKTIATGIIQPLPGGFTTYYLSLTADQIASITDYTNLSVRVKATGFDCEESSSSSGSSTSSGPSGSSSTSARSSSSSAAAASSSSRSSSSAGSRSSSSSGGGLLTPCCPGVSIPLTLHVTFSGCSLLGQGLGVLTNVGPGPETWSGIDSHGNIVLFVCFGQGDFRLSVNSQDATRVSGSCSPFQWVYSWPSIPGCTITVTF